MEHSLKKEMFSFPAPQVTMSWCLPALHEMTWRLFKSQESSWRAPFEFPCLSLTCHAPNVIKTLSSLPEWQHETSGTWQRCRRMQGGKIRECVTQVSGSFASKAAAFPSSSDHCRAFCQLQTARLQQISYRPLGQELRGDIFCSFYLKS